MKIVEHVGQKLPAVLFIPLLLPSQILRRPSVVAVFVVPRVFVVTVVFVVFVVFVVVVVAFVVMVMVMVMALLLT